MLVTGGTSGIGLAVADAFLGRSDAVAVCGRSQTSLDRLSHAHPHALALSSDVTMRGAPQTTKRIVAEL